jgi:hypothetical protein
MIGGVILFLVLHDTLEDGLALFVVQNSLQVNSKERIYIAF